MGGHFHESNLYIYYAHTSGWSPASTIDDFTSAHLLHLLAGVGVALGRVDIRQMLLIGPALTTESGEYRYK